MPKTTRHNTNTGSFEAFLEGWLVRQEHYLDELLAVKQNCHECHDDDLKDLINTVLSHYQQYFEEKSRVAQQNIFIAFSPTWLTSFERSFLWIGGFKPGLAFQVINDSVNDLSEEQSQRMASLIEETRAEEKMLNEELAKIQESVAAPPLLELARRRGRAVDGDIVHGEEMLDRLRLAMESVVAKANLLRMKTATKVVEILNPVQNVKFLTAVTQFQLRIRSWGLQRDAQGQGLDGF